MRAAINGPPDYADDFGIFWRRWPINAGILQHIWAVGITWLAFVCGPVLATPSINFAWSNYGNSCMLLVQARRTVPGDRRKRWHPRKGERTFGSCGGVSPGASMCNCKTAF